MDTVKGIFLVLHLLSWALVLGGWFATIRKPQVTPGMMHGSIGALLFGVILMGMAEMGDGSPNHLKLGIKALFAIIAVVLLALARRQHAAVSAIGTVETSGTARSEEHTSELQSRGHLVCRLLLEKKNTR